MLSGDGDDPMTTTDLSKKQLATILSALDDAPRSPANKGEALRAIGRSAKRFGLSTDDVLAAAPGLLDGRLSPADFRVELHDLGGAPDRPRTRPRVPRGAGAGTAGRGAAGARRARTGRQRGRAGQAKAKAKGGKAAKPAKAAPADKPTPRAGTKQAKLIELLKRPEGATVEQIAEATGWQNHTIRGAISGALKKKLGLNVEATRTREVGPEKTGAKGSSTVYRIVGRLLRQPGAPEPRRRGYRLNAPDSPEADALPARAGPHPGRPRPCARRVGADRGSPSGRSSASTTTAYSAAGGRAGTPTCRKPAPSRSYPCTGSRSWICSGACPRAALFGSCEVGTLPTERDVLPPSRRGLAPGGDLGVTLADDDQHLRRPCRRRLEQLAELEALLPIPSEPGVELTCSYGRAALEEYRASASRIRPTDQRAAPHHVLLPPADRPSMRSSPFKSLGAPDGQPCRRCR